MAEITKNLVWPLSIQPVNTLSNTPKSGITKANYLTGAEIRRTYYDKPLGSFNASFFVSPLLESYEDDMVWFRHVEKGIGAFLFKNPHRDIRPNDVIGTGDGVKTTWVLPYTNWLGIPNIYVDGAVSEAVTIYEDGPNILNFNQSLGNWNSMELVISGPGTAENSFEHSVLNNCYNRGVTKVDNSTVPFTTQVLTNGFYYITVPDDGYLNVNVDIRGDASMQGGAVLATIGSYNAIAPGEWSAHTKSIQNTSGGDFNYASFGGGCNNTTGTFYVGAISVTRGDLSTWYPGSLRMPVVVFDTPPADGAIITSQVDTANRMLRMVARSVTHKIYPDGNRMITVNMDEVPK